jgi:hypothetical protein
MPKVEDFFIDIESEWNEFITNSCAKQDMPEELYMALRRSFYAGILCHHTIVCDVLSQVPFYQSIPFFKNTDSQLKIYTEEIEINSRLMGNVYPMIIQ